MSKRRSSLMDKLTAARTDITELERGQLAQLYLEALVDGADEAIITTDLDNVVTSWNRSAEIIFGYTAEERIGKSFAILIPPDLEVQEAPILERLRNG